MTGANEQQILRAIARRLERRELVVEADAGVTRYNESVAEHIIRSAAEFIVGPGEVIAELDERHAIRKLLAALRQPELRPTITPEDIALVERVTFPLGCTQDDIRAETERRLLVVRERAAPWNIVVSERSLGYVRALVYDESMLEIGHYDGPDDIDYLAERAFQNARKNLALRIS